MGQMQRRKRLQREIEGTARIKPHGRSLGPFNPVQTAIIATNIARAVANIHSTFEAINANAPDGYKLVTE